MPAPPALGLCPHQQHHPGDNDHQEDGTHEQERQPLLAEEVGFPRLVCHGIMFSFHRTSVSPVSRGASSLKRCSVCKAKCRRRIAWLVFDAIASGTSTPGKCFST